MKRNKYRFLPNPISVDKAADLTISNLGTPKVQGTERWVLKAQWLPEVLASTALHQEISYVFFAETKTG